MIIGHSQFERIPLSKKRQEALLQSQIDEVVEGIEKARWTEGKGSFTVRQLERTKKSLKARLQKLAAAERKDDVVTFEELGVDHLYVDEAHSFKNGFFQTKMRGVAGISQNEAQKSADMAGKCRYLDEITEGRGVTFATGTPISNSLTELYILQRYLQYDRLVEMGLEHFDTWASMFREVVTSIELAPEGNGYRARSRFSRFYNIPELMSLFKEIADIKTSDQLPLPVPEAVYETVVLKPSEHQQALVKSLGERAEAVRKGKVDPARDNLLKITNDGRKLALDQRLLNAALPDDAGSKTAVCAEKSYQIWRETSGKRSAQLIFADLSTPKGDGSFNVYDDLKKKLLGKGVPEEEIAFIHTADTEDKKTELFRKVRRGQVRFLLGSTMKMGAGSNVQDKLIALHHLDVGWKPSDLSQREGRIIRQGNENETVRIYRYVTEGTFDAFMWELMEGKQKFISQIMTSKAPVRACQDVDETALSFAEVKALATGNPYIKEKMLLDVEVSKLKLLKASHDSNRYRLEDGIAKWPGQIEALTKRLQALEADAAHYGKDREAFLMEIGGRQYIEKKAAGAALLMACQDMGAADRTKDVGSYQGFLMQLTFDAFQKTFRMSLKRGATASVGLGTDPVGNITRISHLLEGLPERVKETRRELEELRGRLEAAKEEVKKPFPKEEELQQMQERLSTLNALLHMDVEREIRPEGPELLALPENKQGRRRLKKCL